MPAITEKPWADPERGPALLPLTAAPANKGRASGIRQDTLRGRVPAERTGADIRRIQVPPGEPGIRILPPPASAVTEIIRWGRSVPLSKRTENNPWDMERNFW